MRNIALLFGQSELISKIATRRKRQLTTCLTTISLEGPIMSKKQYPSVDYVRQCFRYENGKLFWGARPLAHFRSTAACKSWNTNFSGKLAGCIKETQGYSRCLIHVNGFRLLRSWFVWAIHTGRWPIAMIDHKNRNTLDDSFENLREATVVQNGGNRKINCNSTSGLKGTSHHKLTDKWQAYISIDKKRVHLGLFVTKEQAHKAYCEAALKYHGEFACTG